MEKISAAAIGAALEMPASVAKTTSLLLRKNTVTVDDVEAFHELNPGGGKVYVHRLRKFLEKRLAIKLRTNPGGKYYLRENDYEQIVGRVRTWVAKQYHS